jgi:hypothetical protein
MRRLRAAGRSRWLLPVAIAVAVHGLWLAGTSLIERPRRGVASLPAVDNTPELLRFSIRAHEAAALPPGLSTVHLPFENNLPPPPPELDGTQSPPGATPALGGARARMATRRGGSPPPTARATPARTTLAWGNPGGSTQGLPTDPATALALSARLSSGADTPTDPTAGETAEKGGTASPRTDEASREESTKDATTKTALAALARRHLRLSGSAEAPYRILWEKGSAPDNRPESLSSLPDTVELRRLPLATARELGLSQPHGISVQSPRGLLLLWVEGSDLWLIRWPS